MPYLVCDPNVARNIKIPWLSARRRQHSRRDAGTTTGYNDMAPVEKKDSEGKEKKVKKSTYVPTGKPRGRPKGSVSKKNKPYTGKPRGRPKGSTKA